MKFISRADSTATNELKILQGAVIKVFSDVLVKGCDMGSLLLQIKSEGWDREFIDLGDDSVTPQKHSH